MLVLPSDTRFISLSCYSTRRGSSERAPSIKAEERLMRLIVSSSFGKDTVSHNARMAVLKSPDPFAVVCSMVIVLRGSVHHFLVS